MAKKKFKSFFKKKSKALKKSRTKTPKKPPFRLKSKKPSKSLSKPKLKLAKSKAARPKAGKKLRKRLASPKRKRGLVSNYPAEESEIENGIDEGEECGEGEAALEDTEVGATAVSAVVATSAVTETEVGTSVLGETASKGARRKDELEIPPGTIIYTPMQFGEEPGQCLCPDCDEVVTTRIQRVRGVRVWCCFMCLSLSICTFPCAFIPCFCTRCQDVKHSCPNCERELGRYRQCQCCN